MPPLPLPCTSPDSHANTGTATKTATIGHGWFPTACVSSRIVMASFKREPLRLDAAVLLVVRSERFLPTPADGIEALGVDAVFLDEQALDFVRALLAEIDGLQRHLPHKGLATALAELLDHRIVHVPAQQHGGAGTHGEEPLDRFQVLQVVR